MTKVPSKLQWMLLERNTSPKIARAIQRRVHEYAHAVRDFLRSESSTQDDETIALYNDTVHVLWSASKQFENFLDGPAYIGRFDRDGVPGEQQSFITRDDYSFRLAVSLATSLIGVGIPFVVNNLRPTIRTRAKHTKNFNDFKRTLNIVNYAQLEFLANPIELYCLERRSELEGVMKRHRLQIAHHLPSFPEYHEPVFYRAHAALMHADAVIKIQEKPASALLAVRQPQPQ